MISFIEYLHGRLNCTNWWRHTPPATANDQIKGKEMCSLYLLFFVKRLIICVVFFCAIILISPLFLFFFSITLDAPNVFNARRVSFLKSESFMKLVSGVLSSLHYFSS